jgi:hypothetical protein
MDTLGQIVYWPSGYEHIMPYSCHLDMDTFRHIVHIVAIRMRTHKGIQYIGLHDTLEQIVAIRIRTLGHIVVIRIRNLGYK